MNLNIGDNQNAILPLIPNLDRGALNILRSIYGAGIQRLELNMDDVEHFIKCLNDDDFLSTSLSKEQLNYIYKIVETSLTGVSDWNNFTIKESQLKEFVNILLFKGVRNSQIASVVIAVIITLLQEIELDNKIVKAFGLILSIDFKHLEIILAEKLTEIEHIGYTQIAAHSMAYYSAGLGDLHNKTVTTLSKLAPGRRTNCTRCHDISEDEYNHMAKLIALTSSIFAGDGIGESTLDKVNSLLEILARSSASSFKFQCHIKFDKTIKDFKITSNDEYLVKLVYILFENAKEAKAKNFYIEIKNDGEYIIIEFFSDGKKMSKKEQQNCFNKFFTTKKNKTGLGLYYAKKEATKRKIGFDLAVELDGLCKFVLKIGVI